MAELVDRLVRLLQPRIFVGCSVGRMVNLIGVRQYFAAEVQELEDIRC
jgi:hypothetical protein